MAEWFEDEAFWEILYPFLFPDDRFEAATDEIAKVLELTDFEGRDVLDLCCGPGRHALELAQRGYLVTGVDRSRFLLANARSRATDKDLSVEWVQSDMRDFTRPSAFDLVINMFTSFGYFEDRGDDLRVLRRAHSNLRKGGRLVMQMAGKEQVAAVFQPSSAHEFPGSGLLVQLREVVDDWSRIHNRWTVVQKDQTTTVEFEHTIYSAHELRGLLAEAGFSSIEIYGDLDGNEYGPGADKLIAVAAH